MCLALFAGLFAFCSHVAANTAKSLPVTAQTGQLVFAANPYFNSKQDKVKVHRQFWWKLIPLNTLRITPIRSRHEKKNEVEIQSQGNEQKAKREIQLGRITQVTPLNFNFCHLITIF